MKGQLLRSPRINGLYAITPDLKDTQDLLDKAQQAIIGGAQLIQYRNKLANKILLNEQAKLLLQLCRDYEIPLVINDHVRLAAEINADGVHLGQNDTAISFAKKQLGQTKIIGISCYNILDLAIRAEQEGASYVAFGSFFPSLTKPDAVSVTVNLIEQAKESVSIPIVAIGGIRLDNAKFVVQSGCAAIAVCNDLFHSNNITATATRFSQLFEKNL